MSASHKHLMILISSNPPPARPCVIFHAFVWEWQRLVVLRLLSREPDDGRKIFLGKRPLGAHKNYILKNMT